MILDKTPPGILKDEDAAWMQANITAVPPERKAQALAKLNEYQNFRRQHPTPEMNQRYAQNEEVVLGLYEAPEKADFGPLFPSLPDTEKNSLQQRVANEYFLGHVTGKGRDAYSDTMAYSAERGRVSAEMFGGRGVDSDSGFATEARNYLTKQRDLRVQTQAFAEAGLAAALKMTPGDPLADLEKIKETASKTDTFTPQEAEQFVQSYRISRQNMEAVAGPFRPLAKTVRQLIESKVAKTGVDESGEMSTADEDFNSALDMMQSVPADKLPLVLRMIKAGEGESDKGVAEKAGQSFARGVMGQLRGIASNARREGILRAKGVLEADADFKVFGNRSLEETYSTMAMQTVGNPLGARDLRKATPEEVAKLKEMAEKDLQRNIMAGRLVNIEEQAVDPIAGSNMASRTLYGAANSVGAMLPAFVPYAGLVIQQGAFADQEFNRQIENGADPKTAHTVAQITGTVQAGLDRVQAIFALKMPGVGIGAARPIAGNLAAQITAGVAGTQAAEYAVESAQDAVPIFTASLAGPLGLNLPQQSQFTEELKRWKVWNPEMFMTLLPLSLFGGGFQGVKNTAEAQQQLSAMMADPVALQAVGIAPTQAESIAALPEAKRPEAYKAAYSERNPATPAAATAQQVVSERVTAQIQQGQQEIQTLQESGIAIERTAEGWNVTDTETGSMVAHDSAESAMQTARQVMTERGLVKEETFLDALGEFAGVMQPGRTMEVSSRSGTLLKEIEDAASDKKELTVKAIWDRADDYRASIGQDALTRDMENPDSRNALEGMYVLGRSTTEVQNNAARSISLILQGGGTLDLVEEQAENDLREAVHNKRVSMSAMRGMIKRVETATGDKYLNTDSETGVIEAWSSLVRLYATGTKNGNKITAGARKETAAEVRSERRRLRQAEGQGIAPAAFVKMREYYDQLRAMLGQVARLMKAQKEGKITDLESMIRESVGLKEQDRHEEAVVKEIAKEVPGSIATTDSSFSITTADRLERLSDSLRDYARDPESRFKMYDKARERLAGMARSVRYNDNAFADTEAGTARRDMLRFMQALDSILTPFPPEVRVKVGGFIKLASLTSNRQMETFIRKRVVKLDKVLEAFLRKEYTEGIQSIFAKSQPKAEAGQKDIGKIGVLGHAWFDIARAASEMTAQEAADRIAAIEKALERDLTPGEMTDLVRLWGADAVVDEETAKDMLQEEITILEAFGGMESMDAAALHNAYTEAEKAYITNRHEWLATLTARKERRAATREANTLEAGGGYNAATHNRTNKDSAGPNDSVVEQARIAAKMTAETVEGFMDTHFNAEQQAGNIFGFASESRKAIQKAIYKAQSAETDGITAKNQRMADKLREIFKGGHVKRAAALKALQQRGETGIEGNAAFLSQMQGVHLTMLARDEESAAWLESHGWDTGTLEEIEKWLTPEAKALRDFLAEEYDQQYDRINAVYSRMKGTNLPRVQFYAPRLVEHGGTQADMTLDGQNIAGMSTGFTRRRFTKPQGPPKLADALSAFLANARVVEHYIAWAETMAEFKATVLSRDVRLAAETHKGIKKYGKLARELKILEEGGIKQAILQNEVGKLLDRWLDANSKTALLGKLTLLFKQIPAMVGSMAKIGPVEFMKSAARVMTGQGAIDLGDMWDSPVIQRRLQADSEWARYAAQGAKAKSGVISYIMERNWDAIGYADAAFTTFSASVAYDAAYREAKESGATEEESKEQAMERAGIVVDQTAQPMNQSAKSLMELEAGILARILFAFQGPSRPLWSATYEAVKGGNVKNIAGTYAAVGILTPVLVQTIGNLIKAALTDDELEDVFTWKGYKAAMLAAPAQGMIFFGTLAEQLSGEFGGAPRVATLPVGDALAKLMKNYRKAKDPEKDLEEKDILSMIQAAGMVLGGRAADVNPFINTYKQGQQFIDNLETTQKEEATLKKQRKKRDEKK
jgi:hypothetical protein